MAALHHSIEVIVNKPFLLLRERAHASRVRRLAFGLKA
jgi:hypothetical protein